MDDDEPWEKWEQLIKGGQIYGPAQLLLLLPTHLHLPVSGYIYISLVGLPEADANEDFSLSVSEGRPITATRQRLSSLPGNQPVFHE